MKKIVLSFILTCLALGSAASAAQPLLLNWGTLDTSDSTAQTASKALRRTPAAKTAEASSAWLVQFTDVIQPEWRAWLTASGVEIKGYIPENAYLVWGTPSRLASIAADPRVFYVGEWKPEYKRSDRVRSTLAARKVASTSSQTEPADDPAQKYLIQGFDPMGAEALAAKLETLDGVTLESLQNDAADRCIVVAWLSLAQLEAVTDWPEVEWVEPRLERQLWNDKAKLTNMMNVTPVWDSLAVGGLGLSGKGQTVGIADTGLDSGDLSTLHPDFAGRVTPFGWVNSAYSPSNPWSDSGPKGGHGTHVAGSVAGSGSLSSGAYRGMAYEASLVFQSCQTNLSGLGDLSSLLTQAFENNARIHSDSWGYNDAGYYNSDSRLVDKFTWENPSFLVVIAAGNEGVDSDGDGVIDGGSVSSPSTAKNCLSVGAAENFRASGGFASQTWGTLWPNDFAAEPIKSDKTSSTTSPQGIAAFSGRGPCRDGRIKPDIVAPGVNIVSTRSRAASNTGWGLLANTNYMYMGGTSMATPLTSGAMALLRQWLVEQRGIAEPSAALMKALIMNGARDLAPGQYATAEITPRPDNSQGHGHVNLFSTLVPGEGNFLSIHDATNRLITGSSRSYTIPVRAPGAGPYAITMGYSDFYAAAGTSKRLVNDLDLSVTTPSGEVLYPNHLSEPDRLNNVELIEFEADEPGDYVVTVSAYSVSSGGSQPYALVMRGPATAPIAPVFSTSSSSASIIRDEEFAIDFTEWLASAPHPDPVWSLSSDAPADEFLFDNGSLLFIPATAGLRTFTVTASNAAGLATATLAVTVKTGIPDAPAAPVALSPSISSFTASWSPVAEASSYFLDVIQGPTFTTGGEDLISQGFSTATPSGWTLSGCSAYSASPYLGNALPGDYALRLSSDGATVTSPSFTPSEASLSFWTFGDDDGSVLSIFANINYEWIFLDSIAIPAGPSAISLALPANSSRIRFTLSHVEDVAIDDILVTSVIASAGDPLPAWSNAPIASTSALVTGLDPSSTYTFRVRAASTYGVSPSSPETSVTTLTPIHPPVWTALPALTLTLGDSGSMDLTPHVSSPDAPLLSLTVESSTAPAADWSFSDGLLTFTPSAAGDYTFSFLAANSAGSSSVSLTVSVSAAPSPDPEPLLIPTLYLLDATRGGFHAAWTPGDSAAPYTIQIATDPLFSAPSAVSAPLLSADFSSLDGWTDSGTATDSTHAGLAAPARALGRDDFLITPPLAHPASLSFFVDASSAGHGKVLTNFYSLDSGSSWSPLPPFTADKNGITVTQDLSALSAFPSVLIKFTSSISTWYLDDVLVTSGSGPGSILLEETLSDTSFFPASLAPSTPYFVRVKTSSSSWSPVQTITTLDESDLSTPATVVAPAAYTSWLLSLNLDPAQYPQTTDANHNGFLNWQHYLADIPPDSFLELSLVPADASSASLFDAKNPYIDSSMVFHIQNASSNRYYQVLHSTSLSSPPVTNNLGWGRDDLTVTNTATSDTWFASIRVLLQAP